MFSEEWTQGHLGAWLSDSADLRENGREYTSVD